jgi:hypothetical protein
LLLEENEPRGSWDLTYVALGTQTTAPSGQDGGAAMLQFLSQRSDSTQGEILLELSLLKHIKRFLKVLSLPFSSYNNAPGYGKAKLGHRTWRKL